MGSERNRIMNMEDLGHSHEAESESSPNLHKIILKCGLPYSSSANIYFNVEPGFCDNRWNYNLDSDLLGAHTISKHNPQKHFVLTHKKYEFTLKQWLDEKDNQNNWCQTYQSWGVNRPKEEARQIIQGILRAVYELHSDGSFHGFLYHLENFAIQRDESVIGGDHKEIKRVFLIHENCELNQSFGVPTKDKIKLGKKNDMLAVSNVIFNQIIKGRPFSSYPEDLRNLRELLEQQDVRLDKWKLIVNHPSLWHWKSRFSYFERVWMQYLHAKENTKNFIKRNFNKIKLRNWTGRIPRDTSLDKVFNNRNYRATPEELLHYIRNVHVHYKEEWCGRMESTDYLNEQFIEHKTTEVSDRFLVDLYNMVCTLKIEI